MDPVTIPQTCLNTVMSRKFKYCIQHVPLAQRQCYPHTPCTICKIMLDSLRLFHCLSFSNIVRFEGDTTFRPMIYPHLENGESSSNVDDVQ